MSLRKTHHHHDVVPTPPFIVIKPFGKQMESNLCLGKCIGSGTFASVYEHCEDKTLCIRITHCKLQPFQHKRELEGCCILQDHMVLIPTVLY